MLDVLQVIAPLFLIILIGAFLQRLKVANEKWEGVLNAFALKVGLPALIFYALSQTKISLSDQTDLLIANSIFLVGSFAIAYALGKILKLKEVMFRTIFICLAFGNVAYLGIPTLVQISGDNILPTASLIVAVYLFWFFTIGIGVLEYSHIKKKGDLVKTILLNLVKNPLLIAVVLGILVASLSIQLPEIINTSIQMVGASVTPVVLVVIGLFIGKTRVGDLRKWIPVIAFSVMTLLVLPALFFFGLKLAGYSPSQFTTSIIDAAMPLAITPFALANQYKLQERFIARSIVMSTILSVITIPFWISIL
jgi:predicted permease